ncbi:MAG: cytochrome C oxidase subunit II [Gammaproteobacteria bacterium]|jgi:cytochrome c oxidase subunit 2|nr:cytochrome C oxidase subunit II [Gammaproteobacteria bacterium]
MTSLSPPKDKIWWNEPIEKAELIWITIVFLWGLVMSFMMPFWHVVGSQNISTETYKTTPEKFMQQTQAFVDEYTVRMDDGPRQYPVVKPPPGGDVYLVARLWDYWPVVELKKGESYRFHLSSLDWQHGFSLQPANINIQIVPKYEHVVTFTPDQSGDYSVLCNEYCGIGHHMMIGKIIVVE